MSSVNKVILIGRLGSNPELAYTPTGQSVARFNLATNEVYYDKNGNKQEKTEWHKIVVWGKQAESCSKYLTSGRLVFIEGKIQTRNYQDKNNQKRYITEIIAQNVRFLSSHTEEGAGAAEEAEETPAPEAEEPPAAEPSVSNDKVPF